MTDPKLEDYMRAIVDTFNPGKTQVQDALQRIATHLRKKQDPQPIQLLALRRYLRIGGTKIVAAWPWTAAQQVANQAQVNDLIAEARRVQRNFASANPGYTLDVSPIRDLDKQVRLWCGNPSVNKAAPRLWNEARIELAKPEFLSSLVDAAVAKFREYLSKVKVFPEPTSAAPGTSDHGQMRAVDFVVVFGGQIIAGTESAKIVPDWRAPGWEKALIDAARQTKLRGPLSTPYEPWHWWLPRSP